MTQEHCSVGMIVTLPCLNFRLCMANRHKDAVRATAEPTLLGSKAG